MRRLSALLFVLLALPLALAACGGGDDGDEGAATEGAATGGATSDEAATGEPVHVVATEFAFDPSAITLSDGNVRFELMNEGNAPHALEIEGNGVEEASDVIEGGQTTTLEVSLDEGTYEIYCPVGNHADQGMVGTLQIGAGGGSPGTTDGETDTGETETEGETETGETETEDSSGSGSGGGAY